MRIIALSDIHNRPITGKNLENDLRNADLVVLSGDLTTFCGYDRAELIISKLKSLNGSLAAVAGNCDSSEVQRAITDYGISVDQNCKQYGGLRVIGVNGVESSPLHGSFYHKLESTYTDEIQDEPFMILSHQPLAGSTLSDRGGFDGGSSGIRRFILEYKPILAVCGHIHEAQGTDTAGSTLIVNPGPYVQGCYALIELDLELKEVKEVKFEQAL